MKTILLRGHRWINEGESSLGNNYIQLRRVAFESDLRRGGQVATVIDVTKEEIEHANLLRRMKREAKWAEQNLPY